MKTLKTLGLLILMIIQTLPKIAQYYKTIYKEILLEQDTIIEQTKKMEEADRAIKTTEIRQKNSNDFPEDKIRKVQRLREYQRKKIQDRYNKLFIERKENKCQT